MSPPNRLARRAQVKPSLPPPPPSKPAAKSTDVFGWAIPLYLLLLSGGFAFMRSPLATMRGNELSIDRAAFTVINAVTLTGFGQTIGLDELRVPGQVGVFVLMTGGTVLTLIIGGELVSRIVGLTFSTRLIALSAGVAVIVAGIAGAAGLGDTILHGVFLGVSALGNSGLCIGKVPGADEVATMTILLPLAVAGGLGVPIWLEVIEARIKQRQMSTHGLTSLSMYGGAYIIGMILLLTQLQAVESYATAMATCSASAIATRSAGFHLVSLALFTRAGQWILAGLMIVGPASGGAGGGIKGTTLFVLGRGMRQVYRGERIDRTLTIAAAWIAGFLLLVFVGFLVLLECAPQMPGDRVLFLVISAASNVGWSHDPVSLVKSGLATLSVIMLLGRVMPMAVLWWIARAGGAQISVG